MPRCTFCNHDNPPGVRSCQYCGADFPGPSGPTPGSQDALERRVRDLLAEGRKIEAIRVYREQTGTGLKEAKDAVEAIQRGVPASLPAGVDEPFRSELVSLLDRGQKIEAIKLYRERTGAGLKEAKDAVEAIERGQAPAPTGLDEALERELVGLLQQGQKIEAIKIYRERTGVGLKEAKDAVEALAARQDLPSRQGTGCLGGLVLILGLGIGAFALAQGVPPTISEAQRDGDGFLVHTVDSEYQAGPTPIRVLLPDKLEPDARYPVVYVLPVEPQDEHRYGDGLIEVRKHDLHNQPWRHLRRPDILAPALVRRPPDRSPHPPGELLPGSRRPLHRGPLPGEDRPGGAAAAGLQQVRLGGLQPAPAASRVLRPGGRLGRPADDGQRRQVRLGRHLRGPGELREVSDHEVAGAAGGGPAG